MLQMGYLEYHYYSDVHGEVSRIYEICDVHNEPSIKSQGKTSRGLFSFCGGISPGKTPQKLQNEIWGVFPDEMPPQKGCKDPSGSFQGVTSHDIIDSP